MPEPYALGTLLIFLVAWCVWRVHIWAWDKRRDGR